MIRDLRKTDAPRVFEFLKTEFPEEEALVGTRPGGVREDRPSGLPMGHSARDPPRAALRSHLSSASSWSRKTERSSRRRCSPSPRAPGYVSMVVVDPAYRRRGHAQALLERARVTTEAAGTAVHRPRRPRAEHAGPDPVRADRLPTAPRELVPRPRTRPRQRTAGPSPAIRPFREEDARVLVGDRSPVNPSRGRGGPAVRREVALRGSSFVRPTSSRAKSAAWVIDRGRRTRGVPRGAVGDRRRRQRVTSPTRSSARGWTAADAAALVRTAVDWCVARGAPRIVVDGPGGERAGTRRARRRRIPRRPRALDALPHGRVGGRARLSRSRRLSVPRRRRRRSRGHRGGPRRRPRARAGRVPDRSSIASPADRSRVRSTVRGSGRRSNGGSASLPALRRP